MKRATRGRPPQERATSVASDADPGEGAPQALPAGRGGTPRGVVELISEAAAETCPAEVGP
jgi:hypothetical protein